MGVKMLSRKLIDDFTQRMGLDDIEFTLMDKDMSGDIIAMFSPDTDFITVKDAIDKYSPYRSKIVDNGIEYVEIYDTVYIEGLRTKVAYLVSTGEQGFGVLIKAMTKSVECYVGGELKSFLSFEAMKAYKDRFVVE
jgi:hypothetical protein